PGTKKRYCPYPYIWTASARFAAPERSNHRIYITCSREVAKAVQPGVEYPGTYPYQQALPRTAIYPFYYRAAVAARLRDGKPAIGCPERFESNLQTGLCLCKGRSNPDGYIRYSYEARRAGFWLLDAR